MIMVMYPERLKITVKREAEKTFPIMEARNRAIARFPRRHVAVAATGAMEINFGLMPHRRHRESSDMTTNSRCRRDVIFRISSAGFLDQAIRASLATSQTFYTFRIIDPIYKVWSDQCAFVYRIFFLRVLRFVLQKSLSILV